MISASCEETPSPGQRQFSNVLLLPVCLPTCLPAAGPRVPAACRLSPGGLALAELARAARREKQSQQLARAGDGHPTALSRWGGRQESAEPTQGRDETSSEAAAVHLSQQICLFLGSSPLVFNTREGSTAPVAERGGPAHCVPPPGAQGLALSRCPMMSAE